MLVPSWRRSAILSKTLSGPSRANAGRHSCSLPTPGLRCPALLRRQRAATDRTVVEVRNSARQKDIRDSLSAEAETQLDSILSEIDGLDALRQSVEKRTIDRARAMAFYNGLVDPCYRFLNGLRTMENVSMDKQVRAIVGVSRAREMLSRQDALITSGLIAGRLTAPDLREVSDLAAGRELLYEVNLELLPVSERRRVEQYWGSPDTEPLRTAERTLIEAGPFKKPGTVDAERWQEVAVPVLDRLANDSTEMANRFQDRAEPAGYRVLIQAGIAGVLGFLALLVSVFVSVRVGRELIRDLSRLRKDAHEVSGVRLPSVMRRLAGANRSTSRPRPRTSSTNATRSARSARHSTPFSGPRSKPP
ncbi:nitrate- and nitrite sensing domain-containing protein [Streptomyces sp. M10(2022)]